MRDMVLVVDLDAANSRSVARKLRAERVYCKIVPAAILPDEISRQEPLGLVLAGASRGVRELGIDPALLELGLPVLALGDAAAALCTLLGGQASDDFLEQSAEPVTYQGDLPLFEEVAEGERMMSFVRPLTLAEGMTPAAWARDAVIGFSQPERHMFGLQFQVEQNDPDGILILSNFAQKVCGCTPWWDNDAFIERAVEEIRRVVGEGAALCAISGGVDSGVCAMLGHKAIGERLQCVFVDTGLLRKGESDFVMSYYRDALGLNILRVDAADRFLSALAGVLDPGRKHQITMALLQDILCAQAAKTPGVQVLLQGTDYVDAAAGHGKSAPMATAACTLGTMLVEPVRELFKDEIRRVGEDMGMPPEISTRQPFPWAGLAVRIIGDVTKERLWVLREADDIFRQEVAQSGQNKRLWQYFAVLSDLACGGLHGMAICLRAVHASESAVAMAARLPFDLLERAAGKILKALPQVVRVVYDLTPGQALSGIEWE